MGWYRRKHLQFRKWVRARIEWRLYHNEAVMINVSIHQDEGGVVYLRPYKGAFIAFGPFINQTFETRLDIRGITMMQTVPPKSQTPVEYE